MYLATLFLNYKPCYISCQTYQSTSLKPNSQHAKVCFTPLYPCKWHCLCNYYISLTITIPHRVINFSLFQNCHHPSYQMHLIKNKCLHITNGNLEIQHNQNNHNFYFGETKAQCIGEPLLPYFFIGLINTVYSSVPSCWLCYYHSVYKNS